MEPRKYSVVIVDDHPAVLLALETILSTTAFEVVAQTCNGLEAVQLIKDLTPDFVILDVGLPGLDGLTVMKRVSQMPIMTNFLLFTGYGKSADIVRRCMRAGAKGVVDKTQDISDVVFALEALSRGMSYCPSHVMAALSGGRDEVLHKLSDREFAIFKGLVMGQSGKEIAQELVLSEKTVSTYKTRMLKKLNAKSILDLKRLASLVGFESTIDYQELVNKLQLEGGNSSQFSE